MQQRLNLGQFNSALSVAGGRARATRISDLQHHHRSAPDEIEEQDSTIVSYLHKSHPCSAFQVRFMLLRAVLLRCRRNSNRFTSNHKNSTADVRSKRTDEASGITRSGGAPKHIDLHCHGCQHHEPIPNFRQQNVLGKQRKL